MHVILMGLRASGKSTLGRGLAAALGRPFIDLDEVTAAVMNANSAAEAIKSQGISAFRLAETQALKQVLGMDVAQIVALGGGTPTAPGAAEELHAAMREGKAQIVYLRAQPATLQARLRQSDPAMRPSLTGASVVDEVPALFAQRDELYQQLAWKTLNIDTMDEPQALAALRVMVGRP
jgi:shikimate kinase